jgi:hypothetical protein
MPAPIRDEVQRMFESGNFIAAIKRRQYQNQDGSPGKKFLYINLQRRKATGEIAQHLAVFSSDNKDEVKEHILKAVGEAVDAAYDLVEQYRESRQAAYEARNARYNNRRRYEDEGDAGSGNKAVEDAPVEDNIGNKDSSDSIFKKVTGNLFSGNGK